MKKIFLILVIVLFIFRSYSQNPSANLNLYQMGSLGYDILDVSQRKNETITLPGVMFPLKSAIVSTVSFQKKFPNLKIPLEKYKLILPDMSGAIDTSVVLWYITDYFYHSNPIVNVMLVCQKMDSSIVYYVDENNNQSFRDDISFDFKGEKSKTLTINVNSYKYVITLSNPNLNENKGNDIEKRNKKIAAWEISSKNPKFNFIVSVNSWPGKSRDEFITNFVDANVKKIAYSGNIETSFSLDLGGSLSFYGFNVGCEISYMKMHFSTQEITTYFINPIVVSDKTNLRTGQHEIIYSDEQSTSGINWPDIRYTYGAFISYDIRFKDWIVSPTFEGGSFAFKSSLSFKQGLTIKYEDYIKNPIYYKFGADIKFLVAENVCFLIRGHYMLTKYDNSGFYNALYENVQGIDKSSYSQSYKQLYLGLGFQFRI